MPLRKLAHFTPRLKKLLEEDHMGPLNFIVEHTFILNNEFHANKEVAHDQVQELKLVFQINMGDLPSKKKTAKRQKTAEKEESTNEAPPPPAVYFKYKSEWHNEYGDHSYEATLSLLDEDQEEEDQEEGEDQEEEGQQDGKTILHFDGSKTYRLSGDTNLVVYWDVIDKVQQTLRTSVNPAHFLEVLRCALHFGKATRVVPDKWELPTTRVEKGAERVTSTPLGRQQKKLELPRNQEEARAFLLPQQNRLKEDLFKMCEKIESIPNMPVYIKGAFIHAGKLKETSIRKYEIVVDVVLHVEKEEDGSIKTSQEYKKVVPLLEEFVEEGEVWMVYRQYNNMHDYLPKLIEQGLPEITPEERTRLISIWRPWVKGLSWSDLDKRVRPWDTRRLVSSLVKCNLNIHVELQTEVPPACPARITRRSIAADIKYFTPLWVKGNDKSHVMDIVEDIILPVAKDIVNSFDS